MQLHYSGYTQLYAVSNINQEEFKKVLLCWCTTFDLPSMIYTIGKKSVVSEFLTEASINNIPQISSTSTNSVFQNEERVSHPINNLQTICARMNNWYSQISTFQRAINSICSTTRGLGIVNRAIAKQSYILKLLYSNFSYILFST